MGLISSLNNAMAGLVNPRATDISGRPMGKTEAPAISKPSRAQPKPMRNWRAQAREVWVNRTFNASLQSLSFAPGFRGGGRRCAGAFLQSPAGAVWH